MESLQQMLQDKLDWVMETRGITHASVRLSGEQLARIMSALGECENPALPKIERDMMA